MVMVLPPKTKRVNAGKLIPSSIPANTSLNLGMTYILRTMGTTTIAGETAKASRMR